MKCAHKSDRRSLWSAVARYRFGSPIRYCGNDRKGSPLESPVPEVCRIGDDYQSGTELPHSKGCRHFRYLTVFDFNLHTLQLNAEARNDTTKHSLNRFLPADGGGGLRSEQA